MARFLLGLWLLLALPAAAAPVWRYQVNLSPDLERMAVEAWFEPSEDRTLTFDEETLGFVHDMRVERGGSWLDLGAPQGGVWSIPTGLRGPWHLRYDFRLRQAGLALGNAREVMLQQNAVVSSPGAWLAHPSEVPRGTYRLRVSVPAGVAYESAVWPSSADPSCSEARCEDLDQAPDCVLGQFASQRIQLPGGILTLAYLPGQLKMTDEELLSWVTRTVRGVATYYGRFPVKRALLIFFPRRGMSGFTYGSGGAAVTIQVPVSFSVEDSKTAWTLCHELIHLGIPALDRQQHWFEEGIATYVEPIIRYRLGEVSRDQFWEELTAGLQRGLPQAGDGGLDQARTWGSTYWGGALFCFLADVELRGRGPHSLEAALRRVVAEGGNINSEWPIARVLKSADGAAGIPILENLYKSMGLRESHPDLAQLWSKLGVVRGEGRVQLVEARLAGVRDAIVVPR